MMMYSKVLNGYRMGDHCQGLIVFFTLGNPAPVFRKEFTLDREVKSARLFITAAGYYKFILNGITSGKNMKN
ncbi:MAG: hypothetical protein U9N72_06615 [Bacteroidota bacterium]|nr:hypothetical protein [Bacteroidota bacterium]